MSANTELFVRVLAQIEREPEKWHQAEFARQTDCGTAYCLAGWACALNGLEADFANGFEDREGHRAADQLTDGSDIEWTALRLLRIPLAEVGDSDDVFSEYNTLDDLYRISADLCGLDETVLRDKVAAEVADGQVQQ